MGADPLIKCTCPLQRTQYTSQYCICDTVYRNMVVKVLGYDQESKLFLVFNKNLIL